MKKSTLFIALAVGTTSVFAQDLTSKKGEPYLPEAGDWAISFDATPFLNYAGNMFSGATTSNAAPTANFVNSNFLTITGKMFKDEKTAYRASVRIGFNTAKRVGMIADATQTTAPVYPATPTMKEDNVSVGNHSIGIGLGIEKRRGKTRLQGYYGADLWIWQASESAKYTYGNALAAGGATPVGVSAATTTDFGTNNVLSSVGLTGNRAGVFDTYGNNARITSAKIGQTFGIGLRAFIGAEYFIFPKISLGAEYGWGFGFSTTSNSSYSLESVGGTPASVGTQTINVKRSSSVGIDTDINGGGSGTGTGSLKVILHF